MPFGPRPWFFYVALMAAIGLLALWLGTLCWNEASQRLPPTIAGQLIVFETLSALAYAFVLRGHWPATPTLAGIVLLVAGVLWALRSGTGPEACRGTSELTACPTGTLIHKRSNRGVAFGVAPGCHAPRRAFDADPLHRPDRRGPARPRRRGWRRLVVVARQTGGAAGGGDGAAAPVEAPASAPAAVARPGPGTR